MSQKSATPLDHLKIVFLLLPAAAAVYLFKFKITMPLNAGHHLKMVLVPMAVFVVLWLVLYRKELADRSTWVAGIVMLFLWAFSSVILVAGLNSQFDTSQAEPWSAKIMQAQMIKRDCWLTLNKVIDDDAIMSVPASSCFGIQAGSDEIRLSLRKGYFGLAWSEGYTILKGSNPATGE